MFEAYRVAIALTVSGNSTSALGILQRNLKEAGTHAAILQKKLDELRLTGLKAGIEMAGAFAIAKPIESAIVAAAKLQKEMIGIGLGARGSAGDLDQLRGVIEDIAGKTMFSSVDVAKMGKQLATGTGWDRRQVAADLPVFAQFADAQQIMKGTPYGQSVTTGIQLAHQAGYTKPEDIARYLDLLTKASFTIPGGLGELSYALKYSQNALSTLGLSDDQSILLNATLNRMGLSGSRGGTTAVAALTRSIPGIFGSGLLTGKSAEALRTMGMADANGKSTNFTDGKFDTLKFMKNLADYEQREYANNPEAIARQNILSNLQKAGGVNGARGMELLASAAARTGLQSVLESLNNGAGTAAVQKTFADNSVYQQFENAKTNVTTLMSELGYTLLPTVSAGLKDFNGAIQGLIGLVREHPNVAAGGMYGAAGVAGILTIGALKNFGKFALGGFGLFKEATKAGAISEAAGSSGGGLLATGAGAFARTGGPLAFLYTLLHPTSTQTDAQEKAFLDAMPAPKSSSNPQTGDVYLDSRKVGSVLWKNNENQLNKPNISGSLFDPRMSFTPAGN